MGPDASYASGRECDYDGSQQYYKPTASGATLPWVVCDSGYETSNMGGNSGWRILQLSGTRYDTTQGEITVQSDRVIINKAGWYDVSFWYDHQYCEDNYAQLYAGGLKLYAQYNGGHSWSYHAGRYHFREPVHLKVGDAIYVQVYTTSCSNTGYNAWTAGADRNGLAVRSLTLE